MTQTIDERLADISAGIGRIAGERDECRRQLAAARAEVIAEIRAGVEGLQERTTVVNGKPLGPILTAAYNAYSRVLALLPPTESQRDLWMSTAERYAQNADYWRSRAEAVLITEASLTAALWGLQTDPPDAQRMAREILRRLRATPERPADEVDG